MTLADLFDAAEKAGTLATLPDEVFPRLHKPVKDVALDMSYLRSQAEGKDAARAAAAVRLVGMLAATRLHDSVARPIADAAVKHADAKVAAVAALAVEAIDTALADKAATLRASAALEP